MRPRQQICLIPLFALAACAHHPPPRPAAPRVVAMEPLEFTVVPGTSSQGGPRVEAVDAAGLFAQAGADLSAQRYAQAAAAYDRVATDLPESRFALAARYNAGLAYEGARDFATAAGRYAQVVASKPASREAVDALFRGGACLAEVQRWSESLALFDRLLARTDLTLGDRVEAMTRRGLAQVELGDLPAAERTFRDTLAYFKDNEETERLDSDFYLGMAQFYLGQVAHRYFRALPLRLPQRQLEEDVEAKARMFLTTQARYMDAIRLKNPVWATAAGYQIGALYQEMYDLLLHAPVPAEVDTPEKRQVYDDMLRGKLRVLLEKARHIHELNVDMATRVGLDNDWKRRSREQLDTLDRMLADLSRPAGPAAQ